jgi:hypothetical protein
MNELKIYYFFDFNLRIEFLYFIKLPTYFEYFKIYKYNEYINNHSFINKYPLIYTLIKIYYKMGKLNILKKNKSLYHDIGLLNNFTIYGFTNNSIIEKKQIKHNKINLLINKNKFIKNIFLFTSKLNQYILYTFKNYIILYYYIYYYNIFINLYDKESFILIKR